MTYSWQFQVLLFLCFLLSVVTSFPYTYFVNVIFSAVGRNGGNYLRGSLVSLHLLYLRYMRYLFLSVA